MCILRYVQLSDLRRFLLCLHHVQYNVMLGHHGLRSDIAVRFGLCYNIQSAWIRFGFPKSTDTSSIIKSIAPAWPKYSGNLEYPIGTPEQCSALYERTREITGTENMWVGEYGKLRIEFLDFCITTVREAIDECPTVHQSIDALDLSMIEWLGKGSYTWNEDEIAN